MRQKGQLMMFSDAELSLIKNTFAENEDLLYLIRKVLLQFDLTKEEKKIIKTLVNREVHRVVKKRFMGEVSGDLPLTQLGDLLQTLTKELTTKSVEDMAPLFEAKELEIEYLEQQFEVLADLDAKKDEKIKLADLAILKGKDPYTKYVHTTARNFILGYVDPMLNNIKTVAGSKNETLEQTRKRLEQNSSK